MSEATLACPKCKTPQPGSAFNTGQLVPCISFSSPLLINVFPALLRKFAPSSAGDAVMQEGESSCFYHPQKKAVIPCENCGRFLCGLCDCVLNGRHFCPSCLEGGRKTGKIKNLQNERMLYDSLALSLAILPMIVFYLTFITAPAALYLAIRHWNSPRSIVHGTKTRLVLAILFSSLQIIGWVLIVYFIFTRGGRRG